MTRKTSGDAADRSGGGLVTTGPIPAEELKMTYHDRSHTYYLNGKRAKSVSTVAKLAADDYKIRQWNERMVAIGMTIDANLRENVAMNVENTDALANLCEDAKKTAKAHVKADRGSQAHRVLELILLGEEHKFITDQQRADAVILKRTLDRYSLVPHGRLAEQFVAYPKYTVTGRFDAVLDFETADGRTVLVDLKGLSLDTKLPTPDGWTTMGAVEPGDKVFGSDGKPCHVIAKSDVKRIGTYVVSFDDKTKIICDREHLWATTDVNDRRQNRPAKVRTIDELLTTLKYGGHAQHAVKNTEPLQLPEQDLPIDPYLLGVWLGDGHHDSGMITKGDDLFEILEHDGHPLGIRSLGGTGCPRRTALGLRTKLREAELLGNKHIPSNYLRASHQQRLRLLQGLLDTDGTTADGRVVFCSDNKGLALATEELLLTLGQRPMFDERISTGFGKHTTIYTVRFTPIDITPFRLPRKTNKVTPKKRCIKSRQRLIVSIEPGPDVETACIAVDSPNSLYLCSERMVPTHNTGINAVKYPHSTDAQLAMYAYAPHVSVGEHRGDRADVTTWGTMPDNLDKESAYVLLVEVNEKVGTLHKINIEHGWKAAHLAMEMINWRKEFDWGKSIVQEVADRFTTAALNAMSVDELRNVWLDARRCKCLTPTLQTYLKTRAAELEGAA